jgi:hypothetical protein
LMLDMVLLPPITRPERTRGRSGQTLYGAIPESEEEEKHFCDVCCAMNYS